MASPALLSDIRILERLVADDPECIFVSPLIDAAVQVGPSSLDVRLGTKIKTPVLLESTHIDLGLGVRSEQVERQRNEYFEVRVVPFDGAFVLHPGEFALASTLEFVRLPYDIAARLEGRSSLGRLGLLVHATAGFVDPGFEGTLTFELMNVGRLPVRLSPGLRLGQLCFFGIDDVQVPYSMKTESKYGGMFEAEATNIHLDREIAGK